MKCLQLKPYSPSCLNDQPRSRLKKGAAQIARRPDRKRFRRSTARPHIPSEMRWSIYADSQGKSSLICPPGALPADAVLALARGCEKHPPGRCAKACRCAASVSARLQGRPGGLFPGSQVGRCAGALGSIRALFMLDMGLLNAVACHGSPEIALWILPRPCQAIHHSISLHIGPESS